MKVIDFHTHPFLLTEQNLCFYDNTILDEDDFKSTLTAFGVTKCCGSVIDRSVKTFAEIEALNNSALALKKIWGDFYEPGVHIHPRYVEESCKELERCREAGVRIVGELVPYLMDWELYYDKDLHEIYTCIQDLGFSCVSIHTQQEESMEQAVAAFPDINFVAAHPNDKKCLLRHIERLKKYPNYFLDLSGTGIFRYGLVKHAIEQVGSERLIFGSDFPICNAKMYISAIESEKISDADKENIFYKNAERLLYSERNEGL